LQQALLDLPSSKLDALNRSLEEIVRLMKAKNMEASTTPLSSL
jgi:hypothetical protein